MRRVPINPYNIVPIYDNDTSGSQQAFLYSPTLSLPPMQFYLSSDIGISSWKLVRETDGAEYAQDESQWTATESTSAGLAWYTYFGAALSNPVPDGMYRAVIELASGGILYSHRLCCSILFDSLEGLDSALSLEIESCSQDDDYSFEMSVADGQSYQVILDGSVVQAGSGSFTLTGASVGIENDREYTIIIGNNIEDSNGGRINASKSYTLTIPDITNACLGASLSSEDASAAYGEELAYLEWWGDKDDQSLKLLYQEQAGNAVYKQRLYGKWWANTPEPFIEEELLVTKAGIPVRRSTTLADVIAMDMWPIPDNCLIALNAATTADNKQMVNMGGAATQVDYFETDISKPGEDDQHILNLNLRFNSRYQAGCKEDYTLN